MKEVHFYSSKITSLLMFGGSAIFVYIFFSLDKDRYSLFGVMMYYLGFILFLCSLILSIALLLRRKPMLTVTDQQIIIYHLLVKKSSINFEDIASFYISDTRYRGIKTTEHIYLVLKSSEKHKKISDKRLFYFQQSIQVDMLNVKTKVLLELLNTKLRSLNK